MPALHACPTEQDGQTVLWMAANEGQVAMVQLLVDAGANIESRADVRTSLC